MIMLLTKSVEILLRLLIWKIINVLVIAMRIAWKLVEVYGAVFVLVFSVFVGVITIIVQLLS